MFRWQIIGSTENTDFKMGRQVSQDPISDTEIKDYLKMTIASCNVDIVSTDILSLAFVAVCDDEKTRYYEELNPMLFWPNHPKDFGQENKNEFRVFDCDKKGGEK